jgi:hypothetical protein
MWSFQFYFVDSNKGIPIAGIEGIIKLLSILFCRFLTADVPDNEFSLLYPFNSIL